MVPAPPSDGDDHMVSAHWLFNWSASADDDRYLACSVRPVTPVFLEREDYQRHTCVLKPSSPVEPLVKAALRSGQCTLPIKYLTLVAKSNGVSKPEGTGKANKKGVRSILKIDWATALTKKLFPTESDEEHARIIAGIMGGTKTNVSEKNVQEVCEQLDLLDDENKQHFSGLTHMAEKIRNKCLEAEIQRDLEAKAGRGFLALFNSCFAKVVFCL